MHPNLAYKYHNSYALVIGVNDYKHASNLEYAVNDAKGISKILVEEFGFHNENIITLLDTQAIKSNILREFLSFVNRAIDVNDRIFFFFAGHGFTTESRRGNVGFLVPFDGSTNDLSSLIRWDEITRNADLMVAKHILFIIDACFGGLAIQRTLKPGSMRFLKNMHLRTARQVITAGKANELVADSGGPLPGHSVFTGHFLQGLSGEASTDGIMTANGIMSYVYQKVGRDQYSKQTPHFGYIDGDGDFIFSAPDFDTLEKETSKDEDFLIPVPAVETNMDDNNNIVEQTKEYLTDPRYRIKLHDLIVQETRNLILLTSESQFPVDGQFSEQEFLDRLRKYEEFTTNINLIITLIAYWGNADYSDMMTLPIRRLSNQITHASGLNIWLEMRWYSILLLTYSAGIASIASGNYKNLYSLFYTKRLVWN